MFLSFFVLQNFAPLPFEGLDQIRDLDRAGIVYLRDGATTVSFVKLLSYPVL